MPLAGAFLFLLKKRHTNSIVISTGQPLTNGASRADTRCMKKCKEKIFPCARGECWLASILDQFMKYLKSCPKEWFHSLPSISIPHPVTSLLQIYIFLFVPPIRMYILVLICHILVVSLFFCSRIPSRNDKFFHSRHPLFKKQEKKNFYCISNLKAILWVYYPLKLYACHYCKIEIRK